ncbi:MAG TPA: hypothetical protein VFN10_17515 [Thermoanaerobaculia bacterium]|nr:hypothetical protein [Thermoanaerobaculia bacterium]
MRALRVFVCIALAVATPAFAQQFSPGDIVVAGTIPATYGWPWLAQKVIWLDSTGAIKGTLLVLDPAVSPVDLTFAPDGTLYASIDGHIRTLSPSGALGPPSPNVYASRMTRARDGRFLVSSAPGDTLFELRPDLSAGRQVILGQLSGVDLAADQCTVYYTQGTSIGRFDVCRWIALPAFATPAGGPSYGNLRVLSDGGALVRAFPSYELRNRFGQLVRQYPAPGHGLALARDGGSFWRGEAQDLYRVDIATGATLQGPIRVDEEFEQIWSIAVYGEPRAALAPDPTAIPMLPLRALLFLAALLGAVALHCIRRNS